MCEATLPLLSYRHFSNCEDKYTYKIYYLFYLPPTYYWGEHVNIMAEIYFTVYFRDI